MSARTLWFPSGTSSRLDAVSRPEANGLEALQLFETTISHAAIFVLGGTDWLTV